MYSFGFKELNRMIAQGVNQSTPIEKKNYFRETCKNQGNEIYVNNC